MALLGQDRDAYYLHRLTQKLMVRQRAYRVREDYATGDHPLPNGDPRYRRALKNLQRKARTNYVGLAIAAVSDRMIVRGFKFNGEIDKDASKFWKANNMAMNSKVAVHMAAKLSDIYALVSPPVKPGGVPVITIEDPRICLVEPDPLNPLDSVVGLRFYQDNVLDCLIAVLYFRDEVVVYKGPTMQDYLSRERTYKPENIINSYGGFELLLRTSNPLGRVPLIRGAWRPEYGTAGMAECEDGGWDIQDRINETVLSRLVVTHSQAYRQRWATGLNVKKDKHGNVLDNPFEPGADMVWAVVDKDTKFGDFEQADITQALEAAKEDIGDFAAVTQTPVTYLTNKMVNVSGSAMASAQSSLISKTKTRMESMGWFFEQIIKLCFAYMGDTARAEDIEAETRWADPEQRSMAEVADMVAKFAAAKFPVQIIAEMANFTPEEVEFIAKESERLRAAEQAFTMAQAVANKPAPGTPGANPGSGKSPAPKKSP